MAKVKPIPWEDYTNTLNINRLRGRVLDLPPKKKSNKRQILLIYGHHASIERMHGLAEELSKYGTVTIPDLPGFGGMDSFYTIGEQPSVDRLADYLASFIKMRYKNRRFTIIGMSFGFVVATRMLQKYPEIEKKVDLAVSLVGFSHHEDFKMSPRLKKSLTMAARILSYKTTAFVARYVLLNRYVIRSTYWLQRNTNDKMKDGSKKERAKRVAFEVQLWQCNDVRTYCYTGKEMLTLDLCSDRQLDVEVVHVQANYDRYFDYNVAEQHLGIIYKNVEITQSILDTHAPTIIANAAQAAPFIPKKLRGYLKRV